MEEDREFKHVCRFCRKRFPCGRSLGGHMRSHMIIINKNSADVHKLAKKKLSSAVNSFISTKTDTEIHAYALRDNPKKSKKLADSSEDTSRLYEKFSKERGKGFLSWKPLFGSSMKCNSEKERASNNTSVKDQDSWTSANQNKQLVTVTDSQSDDEAATPNRRRRSKRRTRYMVPANSSFSVANNNGSSSISKFEIEQEQEEVAMCLMMLSRDGGPRGVFNTLVESSDNISVLLKSEIEDKNYVCKKKLKEKKLETGFVDSVNCRFEQRKTQFSASGISRKGSKVNKIQVSVDLFDKNGTVNYSQLHYQFRTENSEVELGKKTELDQTQLGSCKNISSKEKICDLVDPELASDSLKKSTYDASGAEFYKDSHNRSRFECAACNKIFHSYQALGGHRASHKKIKGCFASKFGHNSENNIETQPSPDPTVDPDSKLLKSINNENPVGLLAAECDQKAEKSYVVKKSHECPICLKVFPSGQALGGHKRSHLLGGTEARNVTPTPTTVIENPIPEIHNFIDLNLPATDEEDNNGHLGFKAWWISSINKHEALVGLISNRSHF